MTDSAGRDPSARLPGQLAPVRLADSIKLVDWQQEAVQRWWHGDSEGPQRGTLEVFTGGGKTLIAVEAFARVSSTDPAARLAIVVPTEALARQWVVALTRHTNLKKTDVGLLGAGRRDTFDGKRALVDVLKSTGGRLPSKVSRRPAPRRPTSVFLRLDG